VTDARTAWIRVRERKRTAISWAAAVGFYLALIAIAALIASFRIDDLADFSGPVVVRLGSPEGVDAPRPVEQPAPTAEPVRTAQPEPPEPTPPQPALASAQKPAPTPVPVPAAATTPAVQPAVSQPAIATPPAPIVIKGSESGNSYDMTIDAGSGRAGRSLYVPINLFMPLPFDVTADVFAAIPDLAGLPGTAEKRRQVFKTYYELNSGGRWQLKNNRQPRHDARPELWTMLEDAGYDLRNAEYKAGKYLRPVEILFSVSPADSRGVPRLEDVLVESSSGYSDIDEAVLHGFRKAEFSNSGTISIKGRFTYRF
jgi:hypothetical protein